MKFLNEMNEWVLISALDCNSSTLLPTTSNLLVSSRTRRQNQRLPKSFNALPEKS